MTSVYSSPPNRLSFLKACSLPQGQPPVLASLPSLPTPTKLASQEPRSCKLALHKFPAYKHESPGLQSKKHQPSASSWQGVEELDKEQEASQGGRILDPEAEL